MEKTTIKIAEMATILYAILVFMGLMIDNAYYSQFNIRIVSYMSAAEILLSSVQGFFSSKASFEIGMIIYALLIFYAYFSARRLISMTFLSTPRSLTAKFSVSARYNTIIIIISYLPHWLPAPSYISDILII